MKKHTVNYDYNRDFKQAWIKDLQAEVDHYKRKSYKLKFILEEVFCGIAFSILLMLIIICMMMMG